MNINSNVDLFLAKTLAVNLGGDNADLQRKEGESDKAYLGRVVTTFKAVIGNLATPSKVQALEIETLKNFSEKLATELEKTPHTGTVIIPRLTTASSTTLQKQANETAKAGPTIIAHTQSQASSVPPTAPPPPMAPPITAPKAPPLPPRSASVSTPPSFLADIKARNKDAPAEPEVAPQEEAVAKEEQKEEAKAEEKRAPPPPAPKEFLAEIREKGTKSATRRASEPMPDPREMRKPERNELEAKVLELHKIIKIEEPELSEVDEEEWENDSGSSSTSSSPSTFSSPASSLKRGISTTDDEASRSSTPASPQSKTSNSPPPISSQSDFFKAKMAEEAAKKAKEALEDDWE